MNRSSDPAIWFVCLLLLSCNAGLLWAETRQLKVIEGRKAGFILMSAEQTGLRFTNSLITSLARTNTIVNNGSGVAAGDVDGDGLCDLYFASLQGSNRLYRNLGNWHFEDITAQAGVSCSNQFSSGVVLVDVDGDGDLDLLVNSVGGGTRLFINDGHARFTERLDSGLARQFGCTSLALADIDGDGDLDLYVANYRTTTIMDEPGVRFSVNTVNGLPVVTKVNGIPTSSPEYEGRFVVSPTGSLREAGEPDILYLNDGSGHFSPLSWTGGSFLDENGKSLTGPPRDWGLSVMMRDLNGDGAPDIYVCNDSDSPDRIWINNGKGVFRALPLLSMRHTSLSSMGVDSGDLDRDGYDDLFVVDMLARHHQKRQTQLEKSRPPYSAPGVFENRPQYSRNTLFHNRGDGSYAEIAYYAGLHAADWAWCPVLLDVDLDGYEDVLVANGFHRDVEDVDVADQIRTIKATRKVSPHEELEMRSLYGRWETPNLAFRNRGDLTFEEMGSAWGFDGVGISQGIALADLDNDGDLDVVVCNLNGPTCLYRNETSAPRLAVRLKGTGANSAGVGARLKVMGGAVPFQTQEIISGGRYLSSDEAVRVFAAGSLNHPLRLEVNWRSGKRSVITNLLANTLCIAEEKQATDFWNGLPSNSTGVRSATSAFENVSGMIRHTHVETRYDDFERQPLMSRRLSELGPGVAWIDVDGDGWMDLVVGSGRGGKLGVLRNSGDGQFRAVGLPGLSDEARDDQTGIVGWSSEPGQSTLLIGQSHYEQSAGGGVMQFDLFYGNAEAKNVVPSDVSSVGPLAVTDWNGDGTLELFVGGRVIPGKYPRAASSRLYRQTAKGWEVDPQAAAVLPGIGMVSGAVWTDVTGDGQAELVLACEWGPIKVLKLENGTLKDWNLPVEWKGEWLGGGERPKLLSALTGWWTGVTAGDFDGDGRLDLVVGNWGLNSKYREFLKGGMRLYHGEGAGEGAYEVVEAYWEPEMKKVVPWKDWKTIRTAIPSLGERFASYKAYGEASVEEILGEGFKGLEALRVDVMESVVMINRGDHFECHALPAAAQYAPVFGVCVGDYNGDGKEDVYVSQNFFGTDLETGRYDAGRGLWMRGNGAGGFEAVSGKESGIQVYGEQRGAALCDYDGDGRVDLAVSQNGAATQLFHNRGGKVGLRVSVVGRGRNGNGFGAVLRLGDESGWGAARELHAGAGYWSQDSAVQVLSTQGKVPTKIQIRWPGGKTTEASVPPGAREIKVSAEGTLNLIR